MRPFRYRREREGRFSLAAVWGIGVLLLPVPLWAALPSGPGLSAAYPGDAGVGSHPAVVFSDHFENGTLSGLEQHWGFVDSAGGQSVSFSSDVPSGSASANSLKVTATRGQNTGAQLWRVLDQNYDQLFLRFDVKFAEDYGANHHLVQLLGFKEPPPWPVGWAGPAPPVDRFRVQVSPTLRYKNEISSPAFAPPGAWAFYTYWPEMRSFQNEDGSANPDNPQYFGNNLYPKDPGYPIVRGQWQTVEFMVKMNSTPEAMDGELAMWVDGELAVHFAPGIPETGFWLRDHFRNTTSDPQPWWDVDVGPFEGFRWRTDMDVALNVLRLQHYVSGGAFETTDGLAAQGWDVNTQEATVWFANVVLATEYIGPMQAIPEPGSVVLLGLAAVLLGRRVRFRGAEQPRRWSTQTGVRNCGLFRGGDK